MSPPAVAAAMSCVATLKNLHQQVLPAQEICERRARDGREIHHARESENILSLVFPSRPIPGIQKNYRVTHEVRPNLPLTFSIQ